ncbi:MAG: FHA domain-containing protein, partial [Planctomycetota bacterium]
MRKCAKCGARNDAQAVMCSLCNERLGVAGDSTSYEPRLWEKGRQTFRGKQAEEGAPPLKIERDQPRAVTGQHDDANTTRHYLVPQLGEPQLLDTTKSSAVFGRDEGCEFRLASTKVSRRHSELLFSKADKAYIRDLGSQNGTFINDEKIAGERALEDGDTLRMGDFCVTYRKLAPGEDAAKLTLRANETAVMETVKLDAGDDGALTGDVSILPIGEVLRRLAGIRATGALNIDMSGMRGFILLADGKPTNGSYANL